MRYTDKPADVRQGEEIDLSRIAEFTKNTIPGLKGNIRIKQFPSGFSNLTYLLQVGNSEFVLRRPPYGKKAKGAHDMSREYRMLQALKPVFPYVPEPIAYCEDPAVIGGPFYIMERLKGIILRRNLPTGFQLSQDTAAGLCQNWVDLFCRLHSIDYKEIGLEKFGKPQGYVRRQVEGWSGRYRNARTDDAPDFEGVMRWLHDHMPADCAVPAIVHNDYKLDNVVLNPENPLEIVGILDWEMATIGDPLMDLGGSLAYWITHDDPEEVRMIRMLPTTTPGMLTREEIVALYLKKTGLRIESFDYYFCFGLFRLAVIAQQIYYRYYHGQTKDQRFGLLIVAVQVLEKVAAGVIDRSDFGR